MTLFFWHVSCAGSDRTSGDSLFDVAPKEVAEAKRSSFEIEFVEVPPIGSVPNPRKPPINNLFCCR